MKIFIDSAEIEEIKQGYAAGILDGVTTNPSLIRKAASSFKSMSMADYIREIIKIAKGTPVSLEVIGRSYEEMVSEGKSLYKKFNAIARNVMIKIPVNPSVSRDVSFDGVRAIRELSQLGIPVNCTLIFTPEQALLATKAGAKVVSPFAGRIDDYLRKKAKARFDKADYYPMGGWEKKKVEDNGIVSGIDLVRKIVGIFRMHNIKSQVLAASLRNTRQVREAAMVGADIATVPWSVIAQLLHHEKTVEGVLGFTADIVPEYKEVIYR